MPSPVPGRRRIEDAILCPGLPEDLFCDCKQDCLTAAEYCQCHEALACCDIVEPPKPEPIPSNDRRLQGCVTISPSPPSPSPLPSPPLPLVPPQPPFPPISAGEQIEVVDVITQQVELVLGGTLESIDQGAIESQLKTSMSCFDSCDLSVAYMEGSINVKATAIIVAADEAAVARVSNAARAIATSSASTLSEALGVRVEHVKQQVKSEQRTMSMVVAPPPPAPPMIPPAPLSPTNVTDSPTRDGSDQSTGVLVAGICGGVIGGGLMVGGGIMMYRRGRLSAKVKPEPNAAIPST